MLTYNNKIKTTYDAKTTNKPILELSLFKYHAHCICPFTTCQDVKLGIYLHDSNIIKFNLNNYYFANLVN